MHAVLYRFKVKEGQDETFVAAWKGLTTLIKKHEGSLGSRLHLSDDGAYMAYAQWPDAASYDASGDRLPPEADTHRNAMRNACHSIETVNRMDMVEDLLV
jgi:quinol monooxygenase YgiN